MGEGGELLPMAGGCGENCTCGENTIDVEESKPNYYTIEDFIEGFTNGLREHLYQSTILPREKHHIEDLLLSTDIFVDAAQAFIFGFTTK
jgi:uncharacterized protein Yka (UPF0111/DUF47 family)